MEADSLQIEIDDHSEEVRQEISESLLRALETCGIQCESYAAMLCPVDTGALRNSITHQVDDNDVLIGSNLEYAPYVELGTGKYYPGGRPTPWVYQDAHGNWHYTHGNRAQPYLKPAVADHASQYRSILEDALKDG